MSPAQRREMVDRQHPSLSLGSVDISLLRVIPGK